MRACLRAFVAASLATITAGVIAGATIAALHLLRSGAADVAVGVYMPLLAAVVALSLAFVAWWIHPAYTMSAAIFLTPLAGNWPELGIPGPLSPDRLLFVEAILAVLLRAPPVADRPRLRLSGTHWLLALAVAYALVSAYFAHTLFQRDSFLRIVDAFGILPFLTFLTAPIAFRTEKARRVLLATLVALGAYLGLTVLFETVKLDALVFPRYILDPSYGIHYGRGRGPFVDAVANGLALYTCGVACAIAVASWHGRRARGFAGAVGLLCSVGVFLSLERSVWIGAALGTIVAMLATRRLRRYFVPVAVTVALAVAAALTLIPGLAERVSERANNVGTVWDRKNLTRAALNMVEAKPLFGFGWSRFTTYSGDYFEQAPNYPLTATTVPVHNTPLTYAVELGLIGLVFWLLGLVFGVGGALVTRGPPDLLAWRVGLLAVAMALLVVISAVPPTAWPYRSLWLLAAVPYSGRYVARGRIAR